MSYLWEQIYKLRRFLYQYSLISKNYFKVPIVSVGNITFGGTGKTPIIIWIAKKIEELNLSPMILTRGYKGELENSAALVRSDEVFKKSSRLIGDEPLMIIESLNNSSIVVGRNRSKNLKDFFSEAKPDIVLLDDGFQHLKIHRSLDIVLFDAGVSVEHYKTAPLGTLREGLSSLKDADTICFTKVDQISEAKFDQLLDFLSPFLSDGVNIARCIYRPDALYNMKGERSFAIEAISNRKVICVTALAAPQSFEKSLLNLKADVVSRVQFKDHHFFTKDEVDSLLEEASAKDAIVVMTKKDAVKLKSISQDLRLNYLDISVEFISGQIELELQLRKLLKLDSK